MKTYLKNNFKELILAIFIFFKQAAKVLSDKYATFLGGNLDPFYIFGGLYIWKNYKDRDKLIKYGKYILPVILYATFQIYVLSIFSELSLAKLFINVLKICLCVAVMLYVMENHKKIDILKIIKFFTYINLAFLIIAVTIGRESFLWRLNDIYNDYSKVRLHLFFLEPSELGFHVAIIMIFLLAYLLIAKEMKNKKKIVLYMAINIFCLGLAKAMGAICILAVAIGIMITYWTIKKPTKQKTYMYIATVVLVIAILAVLILQHNPIIMRVFDTINGEDQSNNYRIGVTFDTFVKTLKDYFLVGCGFGNINTEHFLTRYSLVTVIVNSFIYLWIEAGLFGIICSFILIYQLFKACRRSKSTLKWGLFIFLVIYQFTGSHFVSPINWALYGIILSDYHEEKEEI